jgi:sulfotransferase
MMDNGLHFISGLPRSGSTLLSAILRQNPKIYAHMSSPMAPLLSQMWLAMGAGNEHTVFIDDEQRQDMLRSIFDAYYRKVHPHKLVFDTSRIWCAKLPILARLFPRARIVCCVREVQWILDSFERLHRSNPFLLSMLFNGDTSRTVYHRIEALGGMNGVVGLAWHALRDGYYGEFADRMILVDYDALTREPKATLAYLYDKLELPPYTHDFENVVFNEADEFDRRFGLPGLHAVGRKVRNVQRQTLLPPDLVARYAQDAFWKNPESNIRRVPVVLARPF